jgi:hypothetical protein
VNARPNSGVGRSALTSREGGKTCPAKSAGPRAAAVGPVAGALDVAVTTAFSEPLTTGWRQTTNTAGSCWSVRQAARSCTPLPRNYERDPHSPDWTEIEGGDDAGSPSRTTDYALTQRLRDEPTCERKLECRESSIAVGGRRFITVAFGQQTEFCRQQRRIAAFAVAASRVAYAGSLRATLDAICAEVVNNAGLAGVQIVLIKPEDQRIHVYGAAPEMVFPEQFALLLHEARQRGAELSSLRAYRDKRPVVTLHRKTQMVADLVQPGARGRREGQVHPGMTLEPSAHRRMLVGGQVVHHDVQLPARIGLLPGVRAAPAR